MERVAVTISTLALVLLCVALLGNWQMRRELHAVQEQVSRAIEAVSTPPCDSIPKRHDVNGASSEHCESVRERLDVIGTRVDAQTAIINRALGKIIPYELPDDVKTRIASVQDEVNGAIQTYASAASIERIREDLTNIVDALPPWAQEETLPTLVPLRWNLEALWGLANAGSARDEDLDGFIESLDVLLESRPMDSSESLAAKLDELRRTVNLRIVAADKDTAIKNATDLAQTRGNPHLRDTGALTAAIQGLAPYLDDEQSRSLSARLSQQFTHRIVFLATDDLGKTIDQYRQIQSAELRQYAFARASQTAADLLLQLMSAGVSDPQLAKRLQTLHASTREMERIEFATERMSASLREAARRKKYQEWALIQMAKVRSLGALKESGLTEPQALLQLRLDMTKYLAPIDEGLLDVAVGQWFGKVYSNRFEELGDDGKRKLIGSFASTPKMTLDALP